MSEPVVINAGTKEQVALELMKIATRNNPPNSVDETIENYHKIYRTAFRSSK